MGHVSPGHSRVRFAGPVRAGEVVSRTVIFCTQLLVLPQPSVAFQVRVMTPLLPQLGAKASVWLIVTAPHVLHRKTEVWGERVDLGGRRIIKKTGEVLAGVGGSHPGIFQAPLLALL